MKQSRAKRLIAESKSLLSVSESAKELFSSYTFRHIFTEYDKDKYEKEHLDKVSKLVREFLTKKGFGTATKLDYSRSAQDLFDSGKLNADIKSGKQVIKSKDLEIEIYIGRKHITDQYIDYLWMKVKDLNDEGSPPVDEIYGIKEQGHYH